MKISGVVILYNPDIDLVKKNISTYIDYLDKLFVIDNSNISNAKYFINLNPKIEYTANLENQGISKVLNNTCIKSIKEGYDLILTMDQDSFFDQSMIAIYMLYLEKIGLTEKAMLGITPKNYEDKYKLDFNKKPYEEETKLLITSGSIINLKLFNIIGGFNEKLFIDCVDFDYCLKSIINGYKIVTIKNIYLYHIGGTPRKFLGKRIALYSPERYYYIFRNHIYMWLKYIIHFPGLIIKNIFVNIILSILPNIFLGKNKLKFLSSLVKAIHDVPKVIK